MRRRDEPEKKPADSINALMDLSSYGETFVKGLTPDARGCGGHLCRSGGGGLALVRDARSDSYTRFNCRRTGFRRESRAV
jgi:hypothetical protein